MKYLLFYSTLVSNVVEFAFSRNYVNTFSFVILYSYSLFINTEFTSFYIYNIINFVFLGLVTKVSKSQRKKLRTEFRMSQKLE